MSDFVSAAAEKLWLAEQSRTPVPPLSAAALSSEKDAYAIQIANADRRIKAGARLVGYKIGLTSREAQKHFKVSKPDLGHLFADMAIADGAELDLDTLIQPMIEGEIAFVLGRDLRGPGVTVVDVLHAVDYAVAAMEIIDSRIEAWKITAVDTIADNGSSARYVLSGRRRKIGDLDLPSVGMALSQKGEVLVTGAGSAVMGDPLNAVVFLANELAHLGRGLEAGQIVLSGSLSGMLRMNPGDVFRCEMGGLGETSLRATRKGGRV